MELTPILRYDPLGPRLVQTRSAERDDSSKVVFDPWKQTTFDPNDTVTESLWYASRMELAEERARAARGRARRRARGDARGGAPGRAARADVLDRG
ncbi:MAG: hypothetical protein U0359_33495 [Byssovorax sp.]